MRMSKATFPVVTIGTIIFDIWFHPPIESWPKFTAQSFITVIMAVIVGLIFYFRKQKGKALYAGCIAGLFFWQYLMISAFSYIRIFDDIMSKPLKEKMECLVVCIVFLIFAIWVLKNNGIISDNKE